MANDLRFRATLQDDVGPGLKKIKAETAGAGSAFNSFGSSAQKSLGRVGGALSHAKGQISGLASSLTMLGGVGGTLAITGALTSAVTQAKNFGQQMELIRTQAGATQGEVDSMTGSLLAMARAVGTSPEELAKGLYHVESAGLRGAKGLEVLKVAAEGAKVGNADLESVTNALVAANQSGVKGVQDMAGAMGTLNGIVGAGNMRMQDLADAMGTGVLSTAKNYGVTLQSVGAALASMTDQGIPAIDAATRLNSAMRLMAAPTTKAIKLLGTIGLDQTTLATDMRGPGGMLAAITDLKTHLDKSGLSLTQQAALIAGAFGGKQSGAILTLIGNVDLLKQKTDAVAKGAGAFGDAWAATQEEASFKWDKFNASLSAAAIKIGTVALPTITGALDDIGGWVDAHGDDLASGFKGAIAVVKQFVGILGTVAGAAMSMWNAIPGGIRDLLVKGYVTNRVVKFLFGVDVVGSIGKALGGALAGALGKSVGAAVVGAGIGKAFVQPVFVTNPGFGAGGGIAGAAAGEGAAALGAGAGVASLTTILAIAAIPAALAVWAGLSGPKSEFNDQGIQTAGQALRPQGYKGVDPRITGSKGQGWENVTHVVTDAIKASDRNFDRFERSLPDAVAKGTEAGIVHSGVFKKAQDVREAGNFKTSISALTSGKLTGNDALVTGQAIALATINHLRIDKNPDLKSANYHLAELKKLQSHLPADLAAKLAPKIHSLEVAINKTTAAVNLVTAAIHHTPGFLGVIKPGDTRSEGRSMGQGTANPSGSTLLKGDTRSEGHVHGASGLFGMTRGRTTMTVGEAGGEMVAVLRNPRQAQTGGSSEVTINLNVHSTTGIITPGAARDIMRELGPLLVQWMQKNGLVARVGTPLRG